MYFFKQFIIIIFIFIIFFLSTNSYPLGIENNCEGKLASNNKNFKISKLQIDLADLKKYQKRIFKSYIHHDFINKNFKKWQRGYLKVIFTNGVQCNFDAKFRIHGDLKDHLHISTSHAYSSLRVKLLKNQNLLGIRNFKLLLPNTRGKFGNELIFTKIFEQLNILSPRTYHVKVDFIKKDMNFILQEDIGKEFLENNYLKENPIFKGDQNYFWADKKYFDLATLHNTKWIKNNEHIVLTAIAINNLNKAYLDYQMMNIENYGSYDFPYNLLANNKDNFEKLNFYHDFLLIFAPHALNPSNRFFYYDSFNSSFVPIYYDGNPVIIESKKQKEYFDKLVSEKITIFKDKKNFKKIITKLKQLDQNKLLNNINDSGFKINATEIDKLIKLMIENVKFLESNYLNIRFSKKNNNKLEIASKLTKLQKFSNLKLKKIVMLNTDEWKLTSCEIKTNSCEEKFLNKEKFVNIFKKNNFFEKERFIFLGEENKIDNFRKINFNEIDFELTKDIKYSFDKEKKILYFDELSHSSRVIFNKQYISDLTIIAKGKLEQKDKLKISSSRNDNKNLTGCVSLINSQINNINFILEDLDCEDSINFINTEGIVNNILVNNSSSDSIDSDFSNIRFKNVKINNSGNDCVDLSFGEYFLENIELNKCGDKGISAGEKSTVNIKNLKVANSSIGAVSKDSSLVNLDIFNSENNKICLAAYRKKPEFEGGKIYFKKINCRKQDIKVFNYSIIESNVISN